MRTISNGLIAHLLDESFAIPPSLFTKPFQAREAPKHDPAPIVINMTGWREQAFEVSPKEIEFTTVPPEKITEKISRQVVRAIQIKLTEAILVRKLYPKEIEFHFPSR
jgi:hypothetical protein